MVRYSAPAAFPNATRCGGELKCGCCNRNVHAHIAAWVAFFFSYAPILDAYVTSKSYSTVKPPDFVTIIVIVTFVLFMLFGVAQVCSSLLKSYFPLH